MIRRALDEVEISVVLHDETVPGITIRMMLPTWASQEACARMTSVLEHMERAGSEFARQWEVDDPR